MKIIFDKVTVRDASLIFRAWSGNPKNFTYLSATVHTNISDAQQYLEKSLSGDSFALHILMAPREIVGIVRAKIEGHRALVGYVVDESHAGKGIATRAVLEMVTMLRGMEQISRIWATCSVSNPGSVKVLEKNGFEKEGLLKNWIKYPAQGPNAQDNYSYVWQSNAEKFHNLFA